MVEAGHPTGHRQVLAVVGATASGKTAVAIETALRLDGEIISMDSRQVYRGMDIGTAKPDAAERRGVPHHGLDIAEPSERFSAGRFAGLAREWMADIRQRGGVPILAGGTGFFLKALTEPLFEEPPADPVLKERWKQFLHTLSTAELARWAGAVDPASGVRGGDRQRLARVVEMVMLTGRPLSWWHAHAPPAQPPVQALTFVLDMPREELNRRIDARVGRMLEAGLVAEVAALLERGCTERDPGLNATGYIEMIPALRGEYPVEEAAQRIRSATRKYARRQATWLRHQLPADARWLDARRPAADLADEIAEAWRGETG